MGFQQEQIPAFLYHYTNIDSLALILKNRTLRLNNLNNVDDMEEGKTKDYELLGDYTFVSSWTDSEEESIPLWHMYSNKYNGVRIKMKSNPFKMNKIKLMKSITQTGLHPPVFSYSGDEYEAFITQNDWESPDYSCWDINYIHADSGEIIDSIVFQVKYTDDDNLLCPFFSPSSPIPDNLHGDYLHVTTTVETHETNEKYSASKIYSPLLGQYKRSVWAFQKEWRYILRFYPFMDNLINVPQISEYLLHNSSWSPFKYYDLTFDDEAYAEMEIMLGPKVSAGDKVIVESLINQYNPTAKIVESILTDKLK